MKKLLFFVLLALATTQLFAQDVAVYELTAKTTEDAKTIADSVAGLAKHKYEGVRVPDNAAKSSSEYTWCYYNDIEVNICDLRIEFRKYMIGADKDLEIEGEAFYFVIEMRGKFLDVFPIWQRYFSPNSIKEETVKKWKEEAVLDMPALGTEYKFLLTNENDFWQIRGTSVWKKPSN